MDTTFKERINTAAPGGLVFDTLKTLQVNLGNICNQRCTHCHMGAGPNSKNSMPPPIMLDVLNFLKLNNHLSLDITGGCPEMHPNFKEFIDSVRNLTLRLMVRTNLTILTEPGNEWMAEWYAINNVVLIASLPCYTSQEVDRQRGEGVFDKSLTALKMLNQAGYGDYHELNLVHNPAGGYLPSEQNELEEVYKTELLRNYGIRFNRLFTITNSPVGRFKAYLHEYGIFQQYCDLLSVSFNPRVIENLMCRTLVSVDWRGFIFNCDFNQALDMPIRDPLGNPLDITRIDEFLNRDKHIYVDEHCYSCAAGAGSSCTGSLS